MITEKHRQDALAEFTWIRWITAGAVLDVNLGHLTLWHARAEFNTRPGVPLTACKRREPVGNSEVAEGVPQDYLCTTCVQRIMNRAYPTKTTRSLHRQRNYELQKEEAS